MRKRTAYFGKKNQGKNFLRKNKLNRLNLLGMENQNGTKRVFEKKNIYGLIK